MVVYDTPWEIWYGACVCMCVCVFNMVKRYIFNKADVIVRDTAQSLENLFFSLNLFTNLYHLSSNSSPLTVVMSETHQHLATAVKMYFYSVWEGLHSLSTDIHLKTCLPLGILIGFHVPSA